MKTKFFFMTAIVLCAVAANANTWRINYDENAHADFRTLKQACESPEVQDGDIFYMEPGFHNGSDEDNTISRPCTVIGPGWGFKNNAGEEIEVSTTHFTSNISVSENGVHIVGLNAQEVSILLNKLYTNVNNPQRDVIIERCRCSSIYFSYNYYFNNMIRNNLVFQSIRLGAEAKYCTIDNNIICSYRQGGYISIDGADPGNYEGTRIDHNTIIATNVSNCIRIFSNTPIMMITNNIVINTFLNCSAHVSDFSDGTANNYNVYSITPEQYAAETTTKYSDHPTNQYVGATVENTFVNAIQGDYYDEAMRYMVQAGNVAKTAASDGGECGAFGGEHPYVLCGRPQGIPYLYDVDVPEHTTNNTLSISFKVAGQNE